MDSYERKKRGIEQFIDDDEAYLTWLEVNPEGFVINSQRKPKGDYLVLHRAGCASITTPARTNWTTGNLIKTCGLRVGELEAWAREEVDGLPQPCGACMREDASSKNVPIRAAKVNKVDQGVSSGDGNGENSVATDLPAVIETGCAELNLVWTRFAQDIVAKPLVMIADTEEELNWHAFLGHSLDMQGFRAAEFVGVDPLTKNAPGFVPLREQGIGIEELAGLWRIEPIREHLTGNLRGKPVNETLDVLRRQGGEVGDKLASAFAVFPYRKAHWTVRAYLKNCDALQESGYSFRAWLQKQCEELGAEEFPPVNFQRPARGSAKSIELELRGRLQETFYQVGPALAPYMICDWQLWLWKEERTAVFRNFKLDSFHEEFVSKYGRGVVPTDEEGFADWWLAMYSELPPRLANECIWLGREHGVV